MEYFYSHKNNIKPERGDLLIAEPLLEDPRFSRAVILLCEHDEEGSIGFIINKIVDISMDQLGDDYVGMEGTLYFGGPVEQETLNFIQNNAAQFDEGIPLSKGVYWGGNYDKFIDHMQLVGKIPNSVRLFSGYAGWSPGQLESELEQASWIIVKDFDLNKIFEIPIEDLWRVILQSFGDKYKVLINSPTDPRLN